MTRGKTADELGTRLERIRHNRPAASLESIRQAVEEVVTSLTGSLTITDIKLYRELEDLALFIEAAKQEIAFIRPEHIREHDIPDATDELDAVVMATAKATGEILDQAEALERLAADLPAEAGDQVRAAVTRIFEASNFQDITGQRITKVVKTLRHIEKRVDDLLAAFGGQHLHAAPNAARREESVPDGDGRLLNGPQMPEMANSQSEVDAILAGLF